MKTICQVDYKLFLFIFVIILASISVCFSFFPFYWKYAIVPLIVICFVLSFCLIRIMIDKKLFSIWKPLIEVRRGAREI